MDVFVDELQGVPISRNDDALPAVIRADFCHRADDIIRLPTLTFIDGNVHSPEHILHHRHLLSQLFGHSVAGGLVAIVFQVSEGRPVKVKGYGNGLGLLLLLHPLQNVQEAVDGVGVKPLPVGQGLHAEIGTVNDAVAVQDQQLHTFLHLAPWGVSMISMPRAFSSSRIRSASAKFFSFFAAVRAATRASISGSAEAASSCALF